MYYLDMFFPTKDDIPDFGSIKMTEDNNVWSPADYPAGWDKLT